MQPLPHAGLHVSGSGGGGLSFASACSAGKANKATMMPDKKSFLFTGCPPYERERVRVPASYHIGLDAVFAAPGLDAPSGKASGRVRLSVCVSDSAPLSRSSTPQGLDITNSVRAAD